MISKFGRLVESPEHEPHRENQFEETNHPGEEQSDALEEVNQVEYVQDGPNDEQCIAR